MNTDTVLFLTSEQFYDLWTGTTSDVAPIEAQREAFTRLDNLLTGNPKQNVQGVRAWMFEHRLVTQVQTSIAPRELEPDKYFEYESATGIYKNPNINIKNEKTGKIIGYVDANLQFRPGGKLVADVAPDNNLLLVKVNGKECAWYASLLDTNPKLWVLELNAYMFT